MADLRGVTGAASLKANQWTGAFQTPFGTTLSQLYDPIQQAQAAGTLTAQQAQDALTSFNQQWTAFDAAAQQFKAKGGDYATVINQAYDPNQAFMQTVDNVRNNLTSWAGSLSTSGSSASANTPPAAPTLQTILASLGLTPQDAARSASVQTTKRALAAPGYTGTILGGTQGTPQTARPTLLGY